MTILLLSRHNATYDSTTKRFTYAMDKQLDDNIKQLRIESATFRPSTMDSYPHAVFMCSKQLAGLSLRDHCTILKAVGHRDNTEVLCCLHKVLSNTHDIVFQLSSPLRLLLDRRSYLPDIDIYFTDAAGNVLEGNYVATSTPGVQLSELETMHNSGNGNLKFFADCDLESSYVKADGTQASDGDTVAQWKARYPDDESVVFSHSSVDGIVLTTFDDESHIKAVTQNDNGGAWESMFDNDIGFDFPDTGSLFLLWETDSTPGAYETMVQQSHFFNLVLHNSNFSFRSENGGSQHIVIYNIQASTSYLLEIKWVKGATSGSNFSNAVTLNATKLVLDNNTDYTGSATVSQRTSGSKRNIKLSTAQTGMDSKVSSMILLSGDNADQRAKCKEYLEKRWKNQETNPQVDPNAVNADFLCEIRV